MHRALPQPIHLPGKIKFMQVPSSVNGARVGKDVIPVMAASDSENDDSATNTVSISVNIDSNTVVTGGSNPLFVDIGFHQDNDPGDPLTWIDFTDASASGTKENNKNHKWVEMDNSPVFFFHDDQHPQTLTLHVYSYPTKWFPANKNRDHVDLYIFVGSLADTEGSINWTILRVYRNTVSAKQWHDPRPIGHPNDDDSQPIEDLPTQPVP